jgi:hypothetical protein
MKEKLFQQINLKRINFTTPNWRGSCFQSTATPIFKFLLMPQTPPAALLFFEQDLHMKQSVFALVALAVGISGCSGNIGTPTAENIQVRLDVLTDLQECWDVQMVRPDIPAQVKELVDFLSDSDADKEKILSLNDELAKSKKDKEEIKRITGEMAKLIHLPEKYKDTFPAQK